jgi:hypothetical protein
MLIVYGLFLNVKPLFLYLTYGKYLYDFNYEKEQIPHSQSPHFNEVFPYSRSQVLLHCYEQQNPPIDAECSHEPPALQPDCHPDEDGWAEMVI